MKRRTKVLSFPLLIRATVTTSPPTLEPYDPQQGAIEIGHWFELTRDQQQARCEVHTHPQGWEIRLSAPDQGFELKQICRTERQVAARGDELKAVMMSHGWTPNSCTSEKKR